MRVIDGDTLDLENEVRVRLIGIDSPERDTCGYAEATAFLDDLVAGKHVRVEKDISGSDRFERLLRYVYLVAYDVQDDDVLVNEAMVRAGLAKTLAIAPDNRYRDLLSSAQDEARRKGLGIWGMCEQDDEAKIIIEDSQPTDPECIIKGNISESSYGRNYFVVGCPNYDRIKIDTRKGEAYFCTEAEAEAAGFTRSASCANTF